MREFVVGLVHENGRKKVCVWEVCFFWEVFGGFDGGCYGLW